MVVSYRLSKIMQSSKPKRDPKMIGFWKVGRTLGKGFSGHVRIARHSKTGQHAAIKIISKNSLNSRVSLNRLANELEHNLLAVEREIVVMKLIDHPNIMKLYDVWETSNSLYLILEYVQGGELFDYLCNKGRRPTAEVVGYFQQIICAVDHCHRFNVAHRDLKLENILIDQDSNIKIADFGMATWQDDSRGKLLLTSCGSPHYAAPEIISGKPYKGSASDIWSCGVILYAMLAAKLPFDDDDCPALLQKISFGHFEMPQDIDPCAQDLISRMLTLDVEKRITMPEIMRHQFFLSHPLKNSNAMPSDPDMDIIAQPIGNRSAIDPDIFTNLRTLWHGTPDTELVSRLMSPDRNWEKAIYHLLVAYRRKHLDIHHENSGSAHENSKVIKSKKEAQLRDFVLPPRTSHPTPRRARAYDRLALSSDSSLAIRGFRQDKAPIISLSVPSPERLMATHQDSNNQGLPCVTVPDLEDAKIQNFFEQIANHLNVLQAKAGISDRNAPPGTPKSLSLLSLPPVLQITGIPSTPIKISTEARLSTPHDTTPYDHKGTKPLTLRRKNRTPGPIITQGSGNDDKENAIPITDSDLIHRQSPLSYHSKKLGNEKGLLTTNTPVVRQNSKLKKKRYSTGPLSPLFSEAGSSFSLPSPVGAPRRSWLDNVFNFKPAVYTLLSRYDVHTTRSECRRLLAEMEIVVSMEESEKLGLLKCRSPPVKNSANILKGAKSVKFRIEMQWPTPQLCHEGYLVTLLVVLEKGPIDVFRAIYEEMDNIWKLDHLLD